MSHSSLIVLWTYTVLLLIGGLIGFVKGKSKVSLIMSAVFAVPLVFCGLGYLSLTVAGVVTGILAVFFSKRFLRGKKFMPSGFMAILSVAAVAAFLLFR
jgi:uncharacterized membrane protein (UPF0136 family)